MLSKQLIVKAVVTTPVVGLRRLTRADPGEVRRIARTAAAAADLPPAKELLVALAEALGIPGAEHGWADAPEMQGAVRIDRS